MNRFSSLIKRFPRIFRALIFSITTLGCSALAYYYFVYIPPSGPGTPTASGAPAYAAPAAPVTESGIPIPTRGIPIPTRGIPVTIIRTKPAAYPARVNLFGQARPLWQATIRSQVNGRVDKILDALRKGNIVEKNTPLVIINDSRYQAGLARADQVLASARLGLLKEEQEASQARINWEASGLDGRPGSPLVLRAPQMALARQAVISAQADRASAAVDLSYCRIAAPFKGIITERLVSPGDTVTAGDRIAVIAGIDRMEISLSLDAAQVELLGRDLTRSGVRLINETAGVTYNTGRLRDGMTIDPATRLRNLFCIVRRPLDLNPPLLPGTFLRVELFGPQREGLLKLPESALTRQGLVWTVNRENRLSSFKAIPLFYKDGHVFITAPENGAPEGGEFSIAVSPNAAFVTGAKTQPQKDRT